MSVDISHNIFTGGPSKYQRFLDTLRSKQGFIQPYLVEQEDISVSEARVLFFELSRIFDNEEVDNTPGSFYLALDKFILGLRDAILKCEKVEFF